MALTVIADPGDAAVNSFVDLDGAIAYFEGRSALEAWDEADNQPALLVMATRVLSRMLAPGRRRLVREKGEAAYYISLPTWTGTPTDPAQPLAWPRAGMFTLNGAEIPDDVFPLELQYATAELAGQLAGADRTLDNDVAVQGITSVKAGSVAVTFKDRIEAQVLPDAVLAWLVPSWLTEESLEPGTTDMLFEAL